MKTIKTILLAAVITVSSVLSVNASTEPKTTSKVTQEISRLLKNPKFALEKEVLVMVKITLNDNNEMVVLSTDAKSFQIKDYIKNRLNYTKLEAKLDSKLETFTVPVRIVPTS